MTRKTKEKEILEPVTNLCMKEACRIGLHVHTVSVYPFLMGWPMTGPYNSFSFLQPVTLVMGWIEELKDSRILSSWPIIAALKMTCSTGFLIFICNSPCDRVVALDFSFLYAIALATEWIEESKDPRVFEHMINLLQQFESKLHH
ncbi:unnamed protein product [Ilex paraguariensis]